MQMREYLMKYDCLASEDELFNIPLRKEFVLGKIGKGKKVLDVGCLGGKISRLIMDRHNEVWGVELNPAAAHVAEKRGVRVTQIDVEDGLPFPDSTFDFVNAGEVVEHLYDTKSFFLECHRVLKKDQGRLLFTTSNLNSLENRIRIAKGDYPSRIGAYPEDHYGEYVRIFNQSKIRELCRETGFEIEEIVGIPTLNSGYPGRPGRLWDGTLRWVGKWLPSFSKILMVSARRA